MSQNSTAWRCGRGDHSMTAFTGLHGRHNHVGCMHLQYFMSILSFHMTCIPEPEPEGMRNNMDMMILDGSFLGGKGFYSIVSPCKLYGTGYSICLYSSSPFIPSMFVCSSPPHLCDLTGYV